MGGSSGKTTTDSSGQIAPELRPLFGQTGATVAQLQPEIAGQFSEFFQPNPQNIPGFSVGQQDIQNFLRTTSFGNPLTQPQQDAYGYLTQLEAAPLGQSPDTLAAMQAVREPIVNELANAGLGNSGAVGTNLGIAYDKILQQEMANRYNGIGQLQNLGSQSYTQQMQNLSAYGASEEQARQLAETQAQADQADMLRRQGLASNFTTGIMSGFPSITGQSGVTKTSGGSSVICTQLRRQGLMDLETYLADELFGRSLPEKILRGYQRWAMPVARAMGQNKALTLLIAPFALCWAREMRHRVLGDVRGSLIGRVIMAVGMPLCRRLG